MAQDPLYYTITQNYSCEHRVKDSLFIAHLAPTPSREEADQFITKIREKHNDATHNCFAWRIGHADQCEYRFDDDGEPGGSSGRPILQAMEGRQLGDAVIVVTRYFGGTKLGVGGLIRAYSGAAFVVMDAARFVPVIAKTRLMIIFDFDQTGPVHNILSQFGAKIIDTSYSQKVSLTCEISADQEDDLTRQLTDASRGKVQLSVVE